MTSIENEAEKGQKYIFTYISQCEWVEKMSSAKFSFIFLSIVYIGLMYEAKVTQWMKVKDNATAY